MPLHETLYIPLSAPSRGQALSLGLLKAFLNGPPGPGHPHQFLQGCSRRAVAHVVGQFLSKHSSMAHRVPATRTSSSRVVPAGP